MSDSVKDLAAARARVADATQHLGSRRVDRDETLAILGELHALVLEVSGVVLRCQLGQSLNGHRFSHGVSNRDQVVQEALSDAVTGCGDVGRSLTAAGRVFCSNWKA